jgi:uncharacterized Zn finger protein
MATEPIEIVSIKREGDLVFAETTSGSRDLHHTVFLDLVANEGICDCEHIGFGRATECKHMQKVKAVVTLTASQPSQQTP